jgi:hypothetical protein
VCRLDYEHGSELGLSISSVWFNDEREPNFPQPSFPALDILSTLVSKNSTMSEIVVYAESTLMIANVDGRKKTVPRKISLALASSGSDKDELTESSTGTPHALFYSKSLNSMVIALTKWSVNRGSKHESDAPAWVGQRVWLGAIQFLPMEMSSKYENDGEEGVDQARSTIIELNPGERILSMCEWHFSDGQSSKENILVGTAFTESGTRSGRLYFLKASLDDKGRVQGKVTQVKTVDNPVRALAVYDERRVVVSDGNRLSMYGLDRVDTG